MITQDQLIDALSKARELIKIGYIKSAWAKASDGRNCDPWSEEAVCFCGEGAILGATHFDENADELSRSCLTIFQVANKEFMLNPSNRRRILARRNTTTRIAPESIVPSINDAPATTQKDMIRMFTNAIKLVKATQHP